MDSYTALLYNETNILSLLLLVVILWRTALNRDIKAKLPSLMGFICSLIVLTVGDILWAFVECGIISFTTFWGYFTNTLYFAGTLASVYFLFMLFLDVFGYHGNYAKKALLVGLPFAADLIFVLLTPFTHLVFYVDTAYHRADFYVLALAVPYLFVVYLCISSLICSFMPRYYVIRRPLRIMTLYSVATMALALFQLVSSNNFPLYVVGGALICVLMYIDSINELNTVDSVSKLQTRRTFENYLSQIMSKSTDADKNLYLLLADVDDFKVLNDIYGLDEGNRVLYEVAQLLKNALRRGGSPHVSETTCLRCSVSAPRRKSTISAHT